MKWTNKRQQDTENQSNNLFLISLLQSNHPTPADVSLRIVCVCVCVCVWWNRFISLRVCVCGETGLVFPNSPCAVGINSDILSAGRATRCFILQLSTRTKTVLFCCVHIRPFKTVPQLSLLAARKLTYWQVRIGWFTCFRKAVLLQPLSCSSDWQCCT